MNTLQNDKEEQDFRSRSYYDIPSKEKIESMSGIDLAVLQLKYKPDDPGSIVVLNEWRRRDKIEQHELNKKLIKSQNKTAVVASIFGITGTIIGAILTVILTKVFK
ncbi:MAG: hypothetical protein PHP23_07265 [Desulfobacterales bacterium]|nr:hypothetical protein [Bacteroidales bacterium]MDD2389513.1 hypothetical protein [Desulfobacterales bacterium]MDD4072190.1 hypothetical protein [Desulfobacterales bacterium]MDD4391866.1 hypothetical protein [Desulfobacterales bacterium]